jgi:hypothetical protein
MDPHTGTACGHRLGLNKWAPHHGFRVEEGELLTQDLSRCFQAVVGGLFVCLLFLLLGISSGHTLSISSAIVSNWLGVQLNRPGSVIVPHILILIGANPRQCA